MRRADLLPELLCPAGDMDCLYAAVAGGADAVYVGGVRFGARAFAKNFDTDELRRAVRYCHLHSVKLYVTVNTLLYEREIPAALDYCRELYAMGVDALICQDLGLVSLLRKMLPELEIHASTQMSVNNSVGADIAYSLGCTRVVLARELSLSDIRRTVAAAKAEIEIFLHGALCVCHSGQCLFSSLVGGRSGNRGECAQPCRLPYNGGYPLSLKDLSLASHIPELIESGVASLKIEGRMKSPAYVYTVASIYRRLLDEGRRATRNEEKRLAEAFSRGGFTDGYITGRLSGMTGVRGERDKELSRGMELEYTPKMQPITVRATARILADRPSELSLFADGRSYTAYGAIPEAARSSPLDAESVKARLSKTGATMLSLPAENIELTLDGGLNLSPSAINALRRDACLGFESLTEREPAECVPLPEPKARGGRVARTALFLKPELLSSLDEKTLSVLDIIFVPLFSEAAQSGKFGVYIPPVIPDGELDEVRRRLAEVKSRGVEYALISNISHITLAEEAGLSGVGDFRLNVTNRYARDTYESLGICDMILSPELTVRGIAAIGGGAAVYGRVPLMLTERCYMSRGECGGACPEAPLTDRRGVRFPIVREWRHRNLILNSDVTFMADKREELSAIGIWHMIFSDESADAARRVLAAYFGNGNYIPDKFRRIGVKSK